AYSGRGRFVVERIDLNALVDEMTHLLEISISKKAILQYRLTTNLPSIEADATQVRQIIMNLVTNASDAITESVGTITVSTGMLYADRNYLRDTASEIELAENYYAYVEVSDTGCGMDEETQRRIFEPFFTTKITGRGLGLAALLGIVRGHKGGVRVQSESGIGTTFRVLFPCVGAWTPEPDTNVPIENVPPQQAYAESGTIMVVDDEESVRAVACSILEKFGYTVLSAADGREAVDQFLNRHEDILAVLMDITMPHMDGPDAFREMRRIDPDVCVVLSSGYNEQEAIDRFAGKGIAGFIQKPYRAVELIEKIRQILRARVLIPPNE
ncbi:MAG: response regulator, partial [Candidatus Sumerlaeota bacterium]